MSDCTGAAVPEARLRTVLANSGLLVALLVALLASGLARSVASLVVFLAFAAIFVWLPGTVLLDLARVRPRRLDDVALSLVLGTAAAAAAYWLAGRLGARALFLLWPAGAAAATLVRGRRLVARLEGFRAALGRASTLVPLSLVALGLAPYTFLPLFYPNLSPLPDGGLTWYTLPDLVLHASLAQEVTHAIPPTWPFLTGHTATYHYAMDLLPAVFGAGGLAITDGCVRYVPTLLTVSTVLALYALGRDWLGSTGAAAAATLLACFGEDFSWLPGALFAEGSPWAAYYFGVPTTASLYMLNPMLPGLGALAAVLLCLRYAGRREEGAWLALGVCLVVALAHYKVFAAMQLLAALGFAAAVSYGRSRDRRLPAFVALSLLLLVPMVLLLTAGGEPTRVRFVLQPWPYIPRFLVRVGLWASPVLAPLRAAYSGAFDPLGFVQFVLVGVVYLVGSMGLRSIALGELFRARRGDTLRLGLAVFVLVGPLLTLACSVVVPGLPPSEQYNNGVWFYVQAKFLAWLFVVEVLQRWGQGLARPARTLLWAAALVAGLASGVQYLGYQLAVRRQEALSPALMEVVRDLARRAAPGEMVWAREHVTEPLVSLAPLHGLALDVSFIVLDPAARPGTRAVQEAFWEAWRNGRLDPEPLVLWRARYVVADRLDGPLPPGARSGSGVALRLVLENAQFAVYEVVPGG